MEVGRALAESLDSGKVGREQFRRLVTLVDGILLERKEARVLTLPEHFRSDYLTALSTLDQPLPPRSARVWRRDVESHMATARAKLESFQALSDTELADETRTLLEPHSIELESSMAAECIELLLPYLDPDLSADDGYQDY